MPVSKATPDFVVPMCGITTYSPLFLVQLSSTHGYGEKLKKVAWRDVV